MRSSESRGNNQQLLNFAFQILDSRTIDQRVHTEETYPESSTEGVEGIGEWSQSTESALDVNCSSWENIFTYAPQQKVSKASSRAVPVSPGYTSAVVHGRVYITTEERAEVKKEGGGRDESTMPD
jgi:hypothetical protein